MGQTFIDTIETALKNGRVDTKVSETKKTASAKSVVIEESNSEPVVEDLPFEEDDIDDTDVFEETAEESDYPEDLDSVIRKMFKECTDAELKLRVKKVIAEYGKLNDVDEPGLKKIYDMMR